MAPMCGKRQQVLCGSSSIGGGQPGSWRHATSISPNVSRPDPGSMLAYRQHYYCPCRYLPSLDGGTRSTLSAPQGPSVMQETIGPSIRTTGFSPSLRDTNSHLRLLPCPGQDNHFTRFNSSHSLPLCLSAIPSSLPWLQQPLRSPNSLGLHAGPTRRMM